MAEEKQVQKTELTKEELQIVIQCVNAPRQQDLQTATRLIEISNKLSRIVDELPKKE